MLFYADTATRELINGTWFLLNLYMTGIFALYLLPEMRGEACWYCKSRNQAAIGLMLYFVGGTMYHGLLWFLLLRSRLGTIDGLLAFSYVVEMSSAIFVYVGSALCIRSFSKRSWGNYALAIGVCIITALVFFEVFY